MKKLLCLILFVPLALFGQVKNDSSTQYTRELEIQLNNYLELNNTTNTIKSIGFGVMSVSFLSIYSLSQNENQTPEENDKQKDKISASYLFAGIGAIISTIGAVIPIKSKKFKFNNNSINKFNPSIAPLNNRLIAEINIHDDKINLKTVKPIFREGDNVSIKTINGPVVLNGKLVKIAFNRVEIKSKEQVFEFSYNIIEYIKLEQ
jgi:hypothetical protein